MRSAFRSIVGAIALLAAAGCGPHSASPTVTRAMQVLNALAEKVYAQAAATALDLPRAGRRLVVMPAAQGSAALATGPSGIPDGMLLARSRLGKVGTAALDIVVYASSGLVVAGLLCFPDDGLRHSSVVHVHGGLGGLFDGMEAGILQSCVDWANVFGRTAFLPSLRGQDGGEGHLELCLGEADDVAAGTVLLRSLEVADPQRVAVVGGSMGGCVVLRAATKIPNLSVAVAYAPPTDWRSLVAFHRSGWAPAVETACDGSSRTWSYGGPAFADTIDTIICGHPLCAGTDYEAHSPLQGVTSQAAPTLVAAAGADNIVPVAQQVLWASLRQQLGHPVTVLVQAPCDPWTTPSPSMDVLVYVPTAFHTLSLNVISTGLLFLLQELDRPSASVP